jgi:hypothetical protein
MNSAELTSENIIFFQELVDITKVNTDILKLVQYLTKEKPESVLEIWK